MSNMRWWTSCTLLTPLLFKLVTGVPQLKLALVLTLAGSSKLANFFEWSCRSIAASTGLVDMLVFHENNQRLLNVSCASNVKLINLGDRGLSRSIAQLIIANDSMSDVRREVTMMLGEVIAHSPRYLVEIKPMVGTLFQSHLSGYSHWSCTDPDIIWGNLTEWIHRDDLAEYDLLSFAKNWDAGRLFLRGQMTWHRNDEWVNSLWRGLKYFHQTDFATRIGTAYRMLLSQTATDAVFKKAFQTAEGWYSKLVFLNPQVTVKIVGRGFDDFFREPVMLLSGRLHRCQLKEDITTCYNTIKGKDATVSPPSVYSLPPMQLEQVETYYDEDRCKMFWLPIETRFCVAAASYDKGKALVQDKQTNIKLQKMGEMVLRDGVWQANNEKLASRQIHNVGALFHFHHWDEYVATSQVTTWPAVGTEDCMVLYLRIDQALAFESCARLLELEATGKHILLTKAAQLVPGETTSMVNDALAYFRKRIEVGVHKGGHSDKQHRSKDEKMGGKARKQQRTKSGARNKKGEAQ